MKKFKFRLEPLLQLKLHNEKEKQKILAEASHKVNNQENTLTEIGVIRTKNQTEQRKYLTGKVNKFLMSGYSRYYLQLKKEEVTGIEILNVLKKKQESKRLDLVEATKEKKSFEKLRERKEEKYHKDIDLTLQKEQDELASQNFQHKKRLPA